MLIDGLDELLPHMYTADGSDNEPRSDDMLTAECELESQATGSPQDSDLFSDILSSSYKPDEDSDSTLR